jgi:hypothetical protein
LVSYKLQALICSWDAYAQGLFLWSEKGALLHDFACDERVSGCTISSVTGNLVAFGEDRIFVYSLETYSLLVMKYLKNIGIKVYSVTTKPSSRYALLNGWETLAVTCLDTLELSAIFTPWKAI